MSRRRALPSVLLLAAVAGLPGRAAAAPPDGATSSLGQAVQQALEKRMSIQIARASRDAAEARVRQAEAAFAPTARFTTDLGYLKSYDAFTGISGTVTLPQLGPITIDVTRSVPRYQITPVLRLDLQLYDGGRRDAQLAKTEVQAEGASLAERVVARRVAQEVAGAFFGLRKACVQWNMAARREQWALRRQATAVERNEQGRMPDIERAAAQLAARERTLDLRGAEAQIRSAHVNLLVTMGTPGTLAATAGSEAAACSFRTSVQQDLAEIEPQAAGQPDLDKIDRDLQAAQYQVGVSRSAARPQLSLYAQYAGVGRSKGNGPGGMEQLRSRDVSFGLLFSYTFFDGGLTRSRVAEDIAEVERLRLERERASQELQASHWRGASEVERAQVDLDLARERAALARKRLVLARERLAGGTGPAAAVDDAATDEQEAADLETLAEIGLANANLALMFPASPANTAR